MTRIEFQEELVFGIGYQIAMGGKLDACCPLIALTYPNAPVRFRHGMSMATGTVFCSRFAAILAPLKLYFETFT